MKDFTPVGARKVEIKKSKDCGRGVFAKARMRAGEVIEVCPALIFKESEWDDVDGSPVSQYPFAWGKGGALAMGVTSFCNHSRTPNAEVTHWHAEGAMELAAILVIKRGEEVTISYGDTLWFEER